MQKSKIICLILAVVIASAGTIGLITDLSGDTVAPVLPNNSVNTIMDKPTEGTPSDRTAIENLYIAQGELQRNGGFVGETRGTTTSAGITQNVINNRTVINGNVFKEMITVGAVKNAYQLYLFGDNYLFRKFDTIKSSYDITWADTASKYSETDFLNKFGHRSDSLTGYILNDDTILDGYLESEDNGLYTYRYVLDIETAPARMLYEMQANSNMTGFSTFSKAEIIVTMDADWQVKTVRTDCKYKVPMLGGVNCVEDITETFSPLTSQDLPEKDFFEQFFDADFTVPVDEEPDALSVLMDIFAPYLGGDGNLNVSLKAQANGEEIINGLLSAKIDIENIQNIQFAAKLGNDLFVEYEQGKVFVTYQDFKGSTTVDGIMGVVNAFMPNAAGKLNLEGADDILSKFSYKVENGLCTVNLPIDLGGEKIEANIYANVADGKYEFVNAVATVGSVKLELAPVEKFDVPARSGEYPEILGLLDLVQNGVIYGNVNALGMNLDVMFDLATTSLYATGDNLSATYKDETIYLEYGAIKAKVALDDVDSILAALKVAGILDKAEMPQMPTLSISDILGLLGGIEAVKTDNGTVFTLSIDDISVALYLVSNANGWSVERITVELFGSLITLAPTTPFAEKIPDVKDSEYVDVSEVMSAFITPIAALISADSYGADFALDVIVNKVNYRVNGNFVYDSAKNISVSAIMENEVATVLDVNAVVANGVVYLDINGIKAAFALGDMSSDVDLKQAVSEIYGANDFVDGIIETVYGVIDTARNLDFNSIDFANVVQKLDFENNTLSLTLNAAFLGLGDIDIALSAKGTRSVAVAFNGAIGGIELGAEAQLRANVAKVAIPNAADYVLNVRGTLNDDIAFVVSADLLNMDIAARVDALGQTVLVRYYSGKAYAKVGEIAIAASVDQLTAFIAEIMSVLGDNATNVDMSSFAGVDLSLKSLLSALTIDTSEALRIGLQLGELGSVNVQFDNEARLDCIIASVAGANVRVEQTTEQVEKLDVNATYVPVVPLAEQILKIYNGFKDVLSNGLNATLESDIYINGNQYKLTADVKYNGGLYVNATVADAANVLVAVEAYYVDNALYLKVNGVRVATKLPVSNATDGELDINAIFGVLAQAKGYNAVLDEVIEVVTELPDKFNGLDNYLDLLGSLTYNGNVLTVGIVGSLLGLSDFDVVISGESNVNVVVKDLEIACVKLQKLELNATPSCEQIVAPNENDYVTELQLDVMGLTVLAKLDLYNMSVTATAQVLGRTLDAFYVDGAVYINYNGLNVTANIADVDKLLAALNMFVTIDMPEINLDVHEVINSLNFVSLDNGFKVLVAIGGVNVSVSFDREANLKDIAVKVGETDISASLVSGKEYPVLNTNIDYVDIAALVENFAEPVKSLVDAEGYGITLNGSFAFDEYVYGVNAIVNYNNGLYVDADIAYGNNALISLQLWYVQNVIYAQLGDIRFAMNVGAKASAASDKAFNLNDLTGYNPYIDNLIALINDIIAKFNDGSIDYVALLSGLTYRDNALNITVNGAQFGLSEFSVVVNAANGINASVSGLVAGNLTVNLTASVAALNSEVEAPNGDFTTNIAIQLDSVNTVHANIDLLNGVYRFRLNDMFLEYSNNTIKINKGDMFLCGDINAIMEYVEEIDKLVNEFSGATESTMAKLNLDAFKNIDVKAIVNSIAISALGSNSVSISAHAFDIDLNVVLRNGELSYVAAPVEVLGKKFDIRVTDSNNADYCNFDDAEEFVAIEQILADYMPSIRALVNTNSWKFSFGSDGYIDIAVKESLYRVANDSYVEFYYKNTEGIDTMTLRAYINVQKPDANDGNRFKTVMAFDVAYIPFVKNADGSLSFTKDVYITYTGDHGASLKFTVSVDSVMECLSLKDDLIRVVPQIGDILNEINSTKDEALNNAEHLDLSKILQSVFYNEGVFGLTLNGQPLISKLGEIALVARAEKDSLVLQQLSLTYDTISVNIVGLRVAASEVDSKYSEENAAEWQYGSQYLAVQDIAKYDTSNHMNLNSIYSLLSSFVETAGNYQEIENPDGTMGRVRSFYISGTATVALKIVGINMADLDIGLAVRVDITEDNKVYISAKITRTKPNGIGTKFVDVYNDDGGDSYLYYNGVNETFSVIRNSWTDKYTETVYEVVREYCSKCNSGVYSNHKCILNPVFHKDTYYTQEWGWSEKEIKFADGYGYHERHFAAENLTTEEFTANIMDYILELFNFGSTIKDPIVKAINEPSNNEFGIEDILKDYSYTATEDGGIYVVKADLSAIDSNLGALNVDINHDADYTLTNLTVNTELLNGMCKAKIPLTLMDSTYGDATRIVNETTFW